jgi:hypothetical protein
MKTNKAGQINGNSKHENVKVCVHQRMVGSHFNGKGQPSGNLVCRECGTVILDPAKVSR